VEQVLHFVLLSDMTIDEVLVPASNRNLQVISWDRQHRFAAAERELTQTEGGEDPHLSAH
jgi:hypothetical protein